MVPVPEEGRVCKSLPTPTQILCNTDFSLWLQQPGVGWGAQLQ